MRTNGARHDIGSTRNQQRRERLDRVAKLKAKGLSRRQVAEITGLHYQTVKLYFQELDGR